MIKKLLLIIIISLLSPNIFTQVRLGYTPSQINYEFKSKGYDIITNNVKPNPSKPILIIKFDNCIVHYYFNPQYKCDKCVLIPNTLKDLNFFIDLYNKKYEITSNMYNPNNYNTQWQMKGKYSYSTIKLIHSPNIGDYFLWY